MQSKEEIERKLEQTEDDEITISLLYQKTELLEEELEQLETEKQKLIEKLEEKIQSVEKCYQDLIKPYYDEKLNIINTSFMSKREKEEFINKINCLLVQKHCYEEILKIVKGENDE